MARKPRFNLVGVPQHVVQRGNNREPCFYSDEDRHRYLTDLEDATERNRCRVHAYALMTNHVHLLITPMIEHGVPYVMQDVGRRYVRYINHVYRRSGTLWEGRYKSSLVDSEAYLLTCMRYIELNAVRAGMVQHPGDYRWSSYGRNAYGTPNKIITPHPLYTQLGGDLAGQQHAYRELFRYHVDRDALHAIREALDQELVLGRDNFKDRIEQLANRQTRSGRPGRPRRMEGVEDPVGNYYVY